MKKQLGSIVILIAAALALMAATPQDGERLSTNAGTAVSVGHGLRPSEDLRHGQPNLVHWVARHCSHYLQADGTVDSAACNADKSTIYSDQVTHNSRTNAGRDWQAAQMGGTPGAVCTYVATTNDSTSPAPDGSNSDTILASEITSSTTGLQRAVGTYGNHSAGSNSYTVTKQFTAGSGCPTGCTIQRSALFSTTYPGGTMCFESAPFNSVTLNTPSSDTVTITWTITF